VFIAISPFPAGPTRILQSVQDVRHSCPPHHRTIALCPDGWDDSLRAPAHRRSVGRSLRSQGPAALRAVRGRARDVAVQEWPCSGGRTRGRRPGCPPRLRRPEPCPASGVSGSPAPGGCRRCSPRQARRRRPAARSRRTTLRRARRRVQRKTRHPAAQMGVFAAPRSLERVSDLRTQHSVRWRRLDEVARRSARRGGRGSARRGSTPPPRGAPAPREDQRSNSRADRASCSATAARHTSCEALVGTPNSSARSKTAASSVGR